MTPLEAKRPHLPGSAPPIRRVTDQEVRDNVRLVHYVLHRMQRRGQLVRGVDYEDVEQVGMWALWEALRRWQPAKGARSTYCSSYIWGYVMKYQRDVTRAEGFNRRAGEKIAHVASLDAPDENGVTLHHRLAVEQTTEEQVEGDELMAVLRDCVGRMTGLSRAVADRLLADETLTGLHEEFGLSRQRVHQVKKMVLLTLRQDLAA